ncbi:hypothetical protein Tco_0027138 [Tanacetum coccineum]
MNSTKASSFNPSKKIKLTIISPRQLFVNISIDKDVTTIPSPTTTYSSPTPPNAPSKTASTNQTSSSQGNTCSSFQSKLQTSPPSSNEPTYLHPLNPFLNNISDVPPRPLNPYHFKRGGNRGEGEKRGRRREEREEEERKGEGGEVRRPGIERRGGLAMAPARLPPLCALVVFSYLLLFLRGIISGCVV